MSQKRFLSLVTAVVVVGAVGLLILYMMLGHMSSAGRTHPNPSGDSQQNAP